jgi:hypothetical protein
MQNSASQFLPYEIPDLIIVSGGDIISTDYVTGYLNHVSKPVKWARCYGIPCILFDQPIGIFKNLSTLRCVNKFTMI